jgi:hypothetical protein
MFQNKNSHAELKKDETVVNIVLIVKMKSQNPILVLQWETEPWKTKTTEDWEDEQLQKTFELVIQQMQALEPILKVAP